MARANLIAAVAAHFPTLTAKDADIAVLLCRLCLGFACALVAGCGGFPTGTGERAIFVPSPSHNARRPNFVVVHDTTSVNVDRALKTLTDLAREVRSHYLIGRDGTLYQLVDEQRRAWHAGVS